MEPNALARHRHTHNRRLVLDAIGRTLKAQYGALIKSPLPSRLAALLQQYETVSTQDTDSPNTRRKDDESD
jgi:hypothetical protein